jgi:hypothetical protein
MREDLALIDRTDSLRRWRALVLGDLGVVLHLDGDLDTAEASYREAIIESEHTGSPRRKMAATVNLAELMLDRSKSAEARSHLLAVLPDTRRYEVRHAMATALLAEALWKSHSEPEAVMLKSQAKVLLTRLVVGDPSLRSYLDRLSQKVPD